MHLSRVAVALVACAACGPSSAVNGTVGGSGLSAKQAVVLTGTDASGTLVALGLVISDQPDVCQQLTSGGKVAGTSLQVVLTSTGATGLLPPGVGTYRVESAGGLQARGQLVRTVGTSQALFPVKAGQVVVESFRPGADAHLAGTFELTIGESLEKMTGHFSAPICVTPPAVVQVLRPDESLCNPANPCPGSVPKPAEVAACVDALKTSKCSTEHRAALVCIGDRRVCAADGTVDATATIAACAAELSAYAKCAGPMEQPAPTCSSNAACASTQHCDLTRGSSTFQTCVAGAPTCPDCAASQRCDLASMTCVDRCSVTGCAANQTCNSTSGVCEATVATCNPSAPAPDTCGYGRVCQSNSTCMAVPAPTCSNFPGGSAPLAWTPANGTGPVLYSFTDELVDDAAMCTAGTRAFTFTLRAYRTDGDWPAAITAPTGYSTVGTSFPLSGSVRPSGYQRSGRQLTLKATLCVSMSTTAAEFGFAYSGGNGVCGTISGGTPGTG